MIQAFMWTVQKCQESIQIHKPVNSADCSELRTDSTSAKRRERLEEPEGHVQTLAIMIFAAAAMRAESEAVAVAALPTATAAAGVEQAEVIEAAEDMVEEGGGDPRAGLIIPLLMRSVKFLLCYWLNDAHSS
jgi:hypothetical protein